MALVTRCSNPGCLTLFRVTPAQLQAFGGQVRCGTCNTVFDAFPSLTTVADSALKSPGQLPTEPASAPSEPVADSTGPAADRLPSAAPRVDIEPGAGDRAADDRRAPDYGAGEKVAEWTTDAALPAVDAGSPPRPMAVEQVPDLPPAGSLDLVDVPAGVPTAGAQLPEPLPATASPAPQGAPAARPGEPDAAPAPETPPVAAAIAVATPPEPVDPVPQIAPELTDYAVTRGPPPTAGSPASRTRIVLVFGGLLVVVAAGILLFAGDRLPAPLARLLSPAALLREQALVFAVALVAVLCWVLRRHRAAWIAAAVALSLLLGGQLLFAYRTEVAALYPASRPLLEQLCRVARCEVGLPKAADQLVIESSDLQAIDAARPNLIQLAASIRNRAGTDVAFPAIEVTLTDAQDRPLARRVLLPGQYLAGRQPVPAGLRAGEDFSIRLTLDTTELRPVGYRLYLFYP